MDTHKVEADSPLPGAPPRPTAEEIKAACEVVGLSMKEDWPTTSVQRGGKVLGLSRDAAYKAAHSGQLPTIRIGGSFRVLTARLLQMVGAL